MAAAIGAALLLPVGQALLIFAGLGFGLAIPFLAIAFIPPLRAMMPKPGAWMEKFRKWMAIPMALTTIALLWLLAQLIGGAGYIVGGIGVAALVIGIAAVARWNMSTLAIAGLAGVIFAVGTLAIGKLDAPNISGVSASKLDPVRYSAESLAKYRADGRPVFLYFTADWCVTCKVNEATAINRDETVAAFEKAGIVSMVGDYTRRDPVITRFLAKHGRSGVPLYLYYPPQGEAKILPQILTVSDLAGLAN